MSEYVLRWLFRGNHKLTSCTATYRFLRTFAPTPDPAVVAAFGKRAQAAWDVLDMHPRERAFVAGERSTIADLSLCGYLFWEDELGIHWRDSHPAIAAWLERIHALLRWRAPHELMPGHPRPAA